MWLERVIIQNLFCYEGRVEFDFRVPSNTPPEKNVAIVWGRNGHGKTSFLTSMKLLVCGLDEKLIGDVLGAKSPKPDQFVLGFGDQWSGIVNHETRRKFREIKASVEVVWGGTKDGTVNVKREWVVDSRSKVLVERNLLIQTAKGEIEDNEAAAAYLSTLYPRDYVDFVMYNGELIEQLADDDEVRTKTMEKLLEISSLEMLNGALISARRRWARQAKVDDARDDLTVFEGKRRQLEGEQRKIAREIREKQDERNELQMRVDEVEREIETIQNAGTAQDRATLVERRRGYVAECNNLGHEIATAFLTDAPFLFHPEIVRYTMDELAPNSALGAAERARHETLNELQVALPSQVFEQPPHCQPPLTDVQRKYYHAKLVKFIEFYKRDIETNQTLLSLTESDRHRIRQRLENYFHANAERTRRLNGMRSFHERRMQIHEIDDQLENLSDLTDAQRRRRDELRSTITELKNKINTLIDSLGSLENKAGGIRIELEKIDADITRQEEAVRIAQQFSQRATMVANLTKFLDDFISEVRSVRRASLERQLNEHCQHLLNSNALVQKIQLDSKFRLTFLSEGDVIIGKRNMSAGMRQLIATALLWALRDESRMALPVIVDTPLARLDRAHQLTLLTEYFARGSQQMILLPTDSEIDREKYDRIREHVYCEYTLKNDRGNAATLARQSIHGGG